MAEENEEVTMVKVSNPVGLGIGIFFGMLLGSIILTIFMYLLAIFSGGIFLGWLL